MSAAVDSVRIEEFGETVRWIEQPYVPFKTPLGLPIVNPFAGKLMHFMKQYKVTGVELEEAATGVLFGNYRPFMEIKRETYSRSRRTRDLVFNPFTIELTRIGGMAGGLGATAGKGMASVMGDTLGVIRWEISEDPATNPDVVSFNFKTTSDYFAGYFKIRARRTQGGVVFEDDWRPEGGGSMSTSFMAMANLVLLTHPRGFEQIVEQVVEEIKRARARGVRYLGEIGPPSTDLDAAGGMAASSEPVRPSMRAGASPFVVLGEGLAAGMTNFSLIEDDQRDSFGAQLARQMAARFAQPLIQAPGLGDAPGFPKLPVRVPFDQQTTVLSEFPPAEPFSNVSMPGMTLADAVTRRPTAPLINRQDMLQTTANFVLGLPGLLRGEASGPTAAEFAAQRKPKFAIVELGYAEALEAATSGDPTRIPEASTFGSTLGKLLGRLKESGADLIVMTVPDPMDTAHFSTVESASRVLKVPAPAIAGMYGLGAGDRVTVNGLTEMGYQLISKRPGPLPDGAIVKSADAAKVTARVEMLNTEIGRVAQTHGAEVYDLHGLFQRVGGQGVTAGSRQLTSDFLGGFYSLNGYYPGKTGHALIANDLAVIVNRRYQSRVQPIDVATVAGSDPVAMYQQSEGPAFTMEDLSPPPGAPAPGAAPAPQPAAAGAPAKSNGRRKGQQAPSLPLTLPASLEMVLPLNKESSYYGDALRAVHTTRPEEIEYGLTGNLLFGGLGMLDSHLSGSIRITFSPPANDMTHFEVTHGEGLIGDDERLAAPQFFKLPAVQHKLFDSPDMLSSGDLNLKTGEVTNLKYNLFFTNSAIFALAVVNPTLPKAPIQFPGQYGTTWAKFEPRGDGLLDFTFHGTTFIPLSVLGAPVRFPLPFVSRSLNFASIPSDGTALHPHIHLSTKPPDGPPCGANCPDIPENTIREFTASVHNNSFGDAFTLDSPELGGPTTGRSHLTGRFQIQFGVRFGDTVPIAISALPPGGLVAEVPQSPLAMAFKHRIPTGLIGHNEPLKFPNSTYHMEGVAFLDDPLDITLAAVNLKTGKVIGQLLRRGLINTNWLLAMIQFEERIPRNTFMFRGDASFEKGVNGQTVFRYSAELPLPFPAGLKFPAADLKSAFPVAHDSGLDPFLRFQAMHTPGAQRIRKSGGAKKVTASTGDEFSYTYAIDDGARSASFEYTNHTEGTTFRMTGLSWVHAINSRTSVAATGDYDTLTFGGFGTWGKDGDRLHVATVQVSTSPEFPYVTILIDGGVASNVNTKPPKIEDTLP